MRNLKIEYNGKTNQYIPSLLDVFSHFHWLVLLQSKHSRRVKSGLKKIFDGTETLGHFKVIDEKNFMVKSKYFAKKERLK